MTDKPKTWGEMTDAEKGALLLAAHRGKVIEYGCGEGWYRCDPIRWIDDAAYRVKLEPVIETVSLLTGATYGWLSEPEDNCGERNTHRITFNLIDDEPDCSSIRMEALK